MTKQLKDAAPQPAPTGDGTRVWSEQEHQLGDRLLAAWSKAEPSHGVTLHPESYRATFFDLARVALAAPQPADPKPINPGWCEGCNPDNCEGCGAYNPPHYLDTPIDWDLNGVPYTRKQAILDHCGPLALSYIEHAIAYYTKD